jgi:hypothetical protein
MKKKILSILLATSILMTLIPTTQTPKVKAAATINIGDYVQMGKYYDEPILWRCVDVDENGPLMLADRIITIKPYDASGEHKYLDGTLQTDRSYGSNLWETSNMRSWLNSIATPGNVQWLDGCPPIESAVSDGYNDYAAEKGFIADGNFTSSERNAIKSVTQKSILNEIDADKLKVGGTAPHANNSNISTVVQNYDTAYYQNVTDKMFVLDVKQIYTVFQNSSFLGVNYYIGKPTQRAVDNSEYKSSSLNTSNYWYSCLRTPHASDFFISVRIVNSDGNIDDNHSYVSNFGVRPAFYLDLSSVIFLSGNGLEGTPYVADTEAIPTPTTTPTEIPVATPTVEPTVSPTPFPPSFINIGDYVQMGRYYDEPILWRCVDIDENGPLMLADRILTIKPFDAAGEHKYLDGMLQATNSNNNRTSYGSDLWETSNIRSWLNSTATVGNVEWPDGCPPIESAVWAGYNDYVTEKGFLAEGNFTAYEINVIKSVTQKSILNEIDAAKLKIGGTEGLISDYNISTIVQNYDTAYYQNLTDKIFLLDVKQINKVFLNSSTLGTNYYKGKPTQKAIDNSEFKDPTSINTSNYWFNWIRTPDAGGDDPAFVNYLNNQGLTRKFHAFYYSILGCRPAFYMNVSSAVFRSGDGLEGTPFVADSDFIPTPPVSPSPTPPPSSLINIGEYVQMGRYYDEPILWRCVDIDENGPLMLSDRILTFKPFDATGNHKYLDGTPQSGFSRTNNGSNLWETSNIRSWLNSIATAGNVNWLDGCSPDVDKVDGNAYANEKGFLADGNFAASETNAIKTVTQKSILNGLDKSKLKVGGTEIHGGDYSIST